MQTKLKVLFLSLLPWLGGCSGEAPTQAVDVTVTVDEETKEALVQIADARILFGHHSVGDDLISGLRKLADEAGVEIRFIDVENEPIPEEGPVFVDMRPGENRDPKQKIDDFASTVSEQAAVLEPDLALMKLCYVDIQPDTDVDELAGYYEQKLKNLDSAMTGTSVMHVATPLHARPTDLKSRIKRTLGLEVWQDASNENRRQYNEQIFAAFSNEPHFDLARVQTMAPDGTPIVADDYSLWDGYTDDGGHLNDLGQRAVGKAFVLALAEALRAQGTERGEGDSAAAEGHPVSSGGQP